MIKRFNENYLNKIKSNVKSNLSKYEFESPFIESYEDMLDNESIAFYKSIILRTQSSNNEKLDFENSVIIYNGLKDLSTSEISNEKLWVFMTHITHWDYMRKRWAIEETIGDKENFILNRYFFKERPFSRNGLARLWWFSYITFDDKFDDPYYLTRLMLKNEDQDIARMILETPAICRNKKMVEVTLISLNELKKHYEIKSRDYIRYISKYINLTGSVTLWDFLDDSDLRKIINDIKDNWLEKQSNQVVMEI